MLKQDPQNHEPISSTQTPEPPRQHCQKRRSVWKGLGIAALVLGVTGFAASRTEFGKMAIETAPTIIKAKLQPNLIFDRIGRDQFNILLIGRDVDLKIEDVLDPTTGKKRPYYVFDKDSPARSDTMIIVSLDKTHKTIRMVSLPRDAMVQLPPNADGVGQAKLNAAHEHGGPELLRQTIHDELGITIDRHAVIKFEGFTKLIDQIGGIDVNVDGALKRDANGKRYRGNIDYDDDKGHLHVHLKPGMQHLNGAQAHGYVRFRIDIEGDTGRIRRQQQVMRALAKGIMNASLGQIPPLVKEVRKQFETDLKDEEIASAATFAKTIGDAAKIQPMTLFGTYNTRGKVFLNKEKNVKLLAYIFNSTFDSQKFLPNSPSTDDDEIGPTNNATPEALAILRDAGIISAEDVARHREHKLPVRQE